MRMIIIIVVLASIGYTAWRYFANAPDPVIETQGKEEIVTDVDAVEEPTAAESVDAAVEDAAGDAEHADDELFDDTPVDEEAAETN